MSNATHVTRQGGADVQKKSATTAQDRAGGHNVQLKQSLAGMDFEAQERSLSPDQPVQMDGGGASSVAPSVEQLVQDAFTLGGTSRYQVTPEEAMKWLEERKEHAPPEHKYAFIEAIKRVNKRL